MRAPQTRGVQRVASSSPPTKIVRFRHTAAATMVNLKTAALCLIAGSVTSVTDAFSPKPSGITKIGASNEWRAPMKVPTQMVAGGAERAYGEEYYEGE